MSRRAFHRLFRTLGLLTACLLLAVPGTVQAGQRLCTSATIEEPFILPDGSKHEAGSLKIWVNHKTYQPCICMLLWHPLEIPQFTRKSLQV